MRLWYRFSFIYLYTLLIYLVVEIDSRVVVDDDGLSTYFKIYTKEDTNSRINDTSKYDIQEDDYLLGYRFNNDIKCVEVDYKDSMLWKHNETMNMFPYKLLMNFYSKMMLIDYVNKWSYYYKPKTILISSNTINDDLISFYDLTLVTSDGNQFSENDTTQYEVITIGNIVGYRFNRGVRCVELRLKDKVLWKHNSNECGHNYPYCLYVNLLSKMIMVDLSDEWSYYSKYFNSDLNKHVNFDKQCDLFGYLSKTDLKIITSNYDSTLQENEQSHYILKQYKYVYEYRFKDGVKCIELKYDGNPVWKYNNDECQGIYPKVIYVNLYTKMLMVDLNNDWSYFYKYKTQTTTPFDSYEELERMNAFDRYIQSAGYEDDEKSKYEPYKDREEETTPHSLAWTDYDFKDTQLIVLDVENRKNTKAYHYYYDDSLKIAVYIAKEGYLFRKVMQGWSWYTLDKVNIWATPNYYEYANRVLVNNIGKTEIYATMYCINETIVHRRTRIKFKVLGKPPRYNSSYNLSKKEHPHNVVVITKDGSGPAVNDTTQYEVNRDKLVDEDKNLHPNYSSYEYKFKEGAECTLFKVNGLTVWTYKDEENNFPESIFFYDNLKMVFVQFSKHSFNIYKFGEKSCDLVFSNSFKVLDLNINNTGSTSEYVYSKYDGVATYTPNEGYYFRSVRYKSYKIWEAKDSSEFARKAMVSGGSMVTSPKSVVLHFVNGDTRTLHLTENTSDG